MIRAFLQRLRAAGPAPAASPASMPDPAEDVLGAASLRAAPAVLAGGPQAGSRVLRQGMRGSDVAEVQRLLDLPADGIYGPRTVAAVTEWQLENGLVADGIAGPATLRRLGMGRVTAPPVFQPPPLPATGLTEMVLAVLRHSDPDPDDGWPAAIDPAGWAAVLEAPMRTAEIITPERVAVFLANITHETGGLRKLRESTHYTRWETLHGHWPHRFPTEASALPYLRNGYAFAEKVYGGREGNRPEGSGDGWLFRGGGCYQTTFRNNYARLVPLLKLPIEQIPDAIGQRDGAARSACLFWQENRFSALADAGDDRRVRRLGNGGNIGMEHTLRRCAAYRRLLNARAAVT